MKHINNTDITQSLMEAVANVYESQDLMNSTALIREENEELTSQAMKVLLKLRNSDHVDNMLDQMDAREAKRLSNPIRKLINFLLNMLKSKNEELITEASVLSVVTRFLKRVPSYIFGVFNWVMDVLVTPLRAFYKSVGRFMAQAVKKQGDSLIDLNITGSLIGIAAGAGVGVTWVAGMFVNAAIIAAMGPVGPIIAAAVIGLSVIFAIIGAVRDVKPFSIEVFNKKVAREMSRLTSDAAPRKARRSRR